MIVVPRILVLEDDPGWIKNFERHFAGTDWILDIAPNVEEAHEKMTQREHCALVLDVEMKTGGSGLQTLAEWNTIHRPGRVVVISGVLNSRIHGDLQRAGVMEIVDKVDYVDARGGIRQLLARWVDDYVKECKCESQRGHIRTVLAGFREVQSRLTNRQHGRLGLACENEYDVQDILGSVLAPFFSNMIREEPGGSAGGTTSRIDFLFPDITTGLEVKILRKAGDLRRISRELKDDIETYGIEGLCDVLMCFVFDRDVNANESQRQALGRLGGVRRIRDRTLVVEVIIC